MMEEASTVSPTLKYNLLDAPKKINFDSVGYGKAIKQILVI